MDTVTRWMLPLETLPASAPGSDSPTWSVVGADCRSLRYTEHVGPGRIAGRVIMVARFDRFALQRRPEAFHRHVVPAIALAAHRAEHAVLPEAPAVRLRGVLHAAVRMLHQARCRAAPGHGHVERGEREFVVEVVGHGGCPSQQ